MIYYEQSISRDSERKGGYFVNEYIQALPGILFWVVLFVVLRVTRKSRAEAPKNAAQRKLVNDVIAIIERTAPDFDGAGVYPSSIVKSSDGSYGGYVSFSSLRGDQFQYDFGAHGYVVSEGTAMTLASEIAKHFGGEYRPIKSFVYDGHEIVGYAAISPRQLAEEREQKRHEDSLKHL